MLPVFETDALFATLTSKNPLAQSTHCSFQDAEGTVVASASDGAGPGRRLVRALGNAGRARYEWDLLDGFGNRILSIVKPSKSLRGPSPEVSLADGTLLGRAVQERRLDYRSSVTLQGPDDTEFGELRWAMTAKDQPDRGNRTDGGGRRHVMYRVFEGDGAEVGSIAIQTSGPWGFHLTFRPEADLSVRAMAIGYTLCLIQQRSTVSAP